MLQVSLFDIMSIIIMVYFARLITPLHEANDVISCAQQLFMVSCKDRDCIH